MIANNCAESRYQENLMEPRQKWTPALDELVCSTAKRIMEEDKTSIFDPKTRGVNIESIDKLFKSMAEQVPGFSGFTKRQLKDRYIEQLHPEIITTKSAELSKETRVQIDALEKIHGNKWSKISQEYYEKYTSYIPQNVLKNYGTSKRRTASRASEEGPRNKKSKLLPGAAIDSHVEESIETFSSLASTEEVSRTKISLGLRDFLFKIKHAAKDFSSVISMQTLNKMVALTASELHYKLQNLSRKKKYNTKEIKEELLLYIKGISLKKEKFNESRFVQYVYKKKISLGLTDNLDYQEAVLAHESKSWIEGEEKEIILIHFDEFIINTIENILDVLFEDEQVKECFTLLKIELDETLLKIKEPSSDTAANFVVPMDSKDYSAVPFSSSASSDDWVIPELSSCDESFTWPLTEIDMPLIQLPLPLTFKEILFKTIHILNESSFPLAKTMLNKMIVTIGIQIDFILNKQNLQGLQNINNIKKKILSKFREVNFRKIKFSESEFIRVIYEKKIASDLFDKIDYQQAVLMHKQGLWKEGEKKEIVCFRFDETHMNIIENVVNILFEDSQIKEYLDFLNIESHINVGTESPIDFGFDLFA